MQTSIVCITALRVRGCASHEQQNNAGAHLFISPFPLRASAYLLLTRSCICPAIIIGANELAHNLICMFIMHGCDEIR